MQTLIALVDAKGDLVNAKNHRLHLLTYIIELETRMLNAGVELRPATDITFHDFVGSARRM